MFRVLKVWINLSLLTKTIISQFYANVKEIFPINKLTNTPHFVKDLSWSSAYARTEQTKQLKSSSPICPQRG